MVFPVAALVKCKLGRALGHQELLEQGLDHFSHGVRAADVKCVHTAVAAATGRESPGAGRGRGGFAELHLHVNEASVNPVRLLEREERGGHTERVVRQDWGKRAS